MIHVKAADARRAAALICHHGVRDEQGMTTVINEAIEAERYVELLLGVLMVYDSVVPVLHSTTGLAAIRATIVDLATREEHEAREVEEEA